MRSFVRADNDEVSVLGYGSPPGVFALVFVVALGTGIMQSLVALGKYRAHGWPFFISADKRIEWAAAAVYYAGALFCLVAFFTSR